MRIALVHEFLNQLGGAERVLENFLEIWPDATVHVILDNEKKINGQFKNIKKRVSYLDKFPFAHSHPRLLLALMPRAVESFNFDDFDLVISDSSSFAKGVKTDKLHICYCHTPTRFLWTDNDYLGYQRYPGILKWFGQLVLPSIRQWDYLASRRPNFFIANSVNVQLRIKKYYKRDSIIIPPPVDTEFFHPVGAKQDYFFIASRLEPYKKFNLVVEAFNELGLKLKVAGEGTDLARLKNIANSNIEFLGRVSDEDLRKLYAEAKAYIFPAEEDAGITVVEAMSCGTPVIAYGAGGSLETVVSGVTGEFFKEQTVSSIKQAVVAFDSGKYDPEKIRSHAMQYDKKIFKEKIKDYVEEKYREIQM